MFEERKLLLLDRSHMEDVTRLLSGLHAKGVRLWVDDGRLRYSAPKGSLTTGELQSLASRKAVLLEYLGRSPFAPADLPLVRREDPTALVPLTFSQQWHWNRWKRPNQRFRTACVAAKLIGRVDAYKLRESLMELVRQHESLRTKFKLTGNGVQQAVDDCFARDFEVIDLTQISAASRESESQTQIRRLIAFPVNPEVGPVFDAKIIRLSSMEHVLVMTRDQLIADGISNRVMFRDIFSLYSQCREGLSPCLPHTSAQFPDYALWQHKTRPSWAARHGPYWNERLEDFGRVRILRREGLLGEPRSIIVVQPVKFGRTLSAALRDLSRREGTTLAMAVLSAYAALIFRWCGIRDLVISVVTMGRNLPELENTLGAFAYPLFLRLELSEQDDFLDLLQYVTREYREAQSHSDSGRIGGQTPTPDIERNPTFNWASHDVRADSKAYMNTLEPHDRTLHLEPFMVDRALKEIESEFLDGTDLDKEPSLILSDGSEGIEGSFVITGLSVPETTIKTFARNFSRFAEFLAAAPDTLVMSTSCVS